MTSEGDANTETKGNLILSSSRSSLINSQNLLESSRKLDKEINTF